MKSLLIAVCVLLGGVVAWAEEPQILPATAITAPPDQLPIPKVDPLPIVPEPSPPPDEIDPAPHIAGRGPLYIDLQTYRPVGRDLAALLRLGPDSKGAIWGDRVPIHAIFNPNTAFKVDGAIRGYYRNDQRVEWSGLESTFGAEGTALPAFVTVHDNWIVTAHGELFLNQQFGPSVLVGPAMAAYKSNFDVNTFELFQLFVEATYDDFSIRLGRSRTPFGRYQSPMFTNTMSDAQFLRTDVIGFVETGLFLHYQPGLFVVDLACVNGEPDLDTNSSKGVVARVGVEDELWTAGVSMKYHDGISSEFQKRYNNIVGMDASAVFGRWTIYGEAVYDQHGFQNDPTANPFADPARVGVRSYYGRDVFVGRDTAVGGWGAYLGVTCRGEKWVADLSYGSYQTEQIGDPAHDEPTRRLLFKAAYRPIPQLQLFVGGLAENRRPLSPLIARMHPFAMYAGLQYGF